MYSGRTLYPAFLRRRSVTSRKYCAFGEGREIRQTASHCCRGCGGRSSRYAGRQQYAQDAFLRRGQGSGLRGSPKAMLEDIAVLTGGRAISEDLGIKLESLEIKDLGRAKKIKIDKDNTTIVEGAGKTVDIKGRISQIRHQIDSTDSSYDKEKLRERLAKLSGGVAIISVGAAYRNGNEGKEGPRGRCPACHTRCR